MAAGLRAGLALRPGCDPFGISTERPGVRLTLSSVLSELVPSRGTWHQQLPLLYLWGSHLTPLQHGVQPETQGQISGAFCLGTLCSAPSYSSHLGLSEF